MKRIVLCSVIGLFLFACSNNVEESTSFNSTDIMLKSTDPRLEMYSRPYFEHYAYFDSLPHNEKTVMWEVKYAQLMTQVWDVDQKQVIDSIFSWLHRVISLTALVRAIKSLKILNLNYSSIL